MQTDRVRPERGRSGIGRLGAWIGARLVVLGWVYLTFFWGWVGLRLVFGDRWWWLFGATSLAVYLFLPLAFWVVLGALGRQRGLFLLSALGVMIGIAHYGSLFFPQPPPLEASGPRLTVMAYNVLAFNQYPERVVAAIRAANADVVAIHELNHPIAAAIRQELANEYPYQILEPDTSVHGLGTISRFPLETTGKSLPGLWVGSPQISSLQLGDSEVLVVNLHTIATNTGNPARMNESIKIREDEAQAIVDFVRANPQPILIPIDFNATDLSVAYQIVTTVVQDPWRSVGRGLGHTFPGGLSEGSSRFLAGRFAMPQWFARIDYIFYSPHWQAQSAELGPWDGISDHRPVVVTFALVME